MSIPAHNEVIRPPLEDLPEFYVYIWNENDFVQMQWFYVVEWPRNSGPTISIMSCHVYQRWARDAPWERRETLPSDIPMSDSILQRLADHAGKQLYRHSVVIGPMKAVPLNFFDRAEEAAA